MGRSNLRFKTSPIVLKRLLQAIGISHRDLSSVVPFGRQTITDMLNRAGYFPGKPDEIYQYMAAIEKIISQNSQSMNWLEMHGFTMKNIWDIDRFPDAFLNQRNREPVILSLVKSGPEQSGPSGQSEQSEQSGQSGQYGQSEPSGDKQTVQTEKLIINWEVEMLTPEAKKLFKLFKDPFIDDIQQESDIYMSDKHRYIEAAMLDAARHGGFLAVVGEVGSGKSIIRKKVLSQLKRDNNVLIISPQGRDKKLLTASAICDAIIFDISTEKPKNRLEEKTRQVIRLLTERADNSQRHCLFIEEAHNLSVETLKHLKGFYELEAVTDGFRRLLGILLIGQLEMMRKLDERSNFDAREVIRRCQIVELGPLDSSGDLEKYLTLKFKRCGIEINNIFENDAFQAIRDRLTVVNGKSKQSHLYPLLINNYTAKALNLAAQLGQKKVTAEVVYEV